ncbi:thioredoxin domain-containing protein [Vitiosangium sp. GDMCC 1.1324]|uniref:thioredoxin domain-containing protein n=1 Tax=Vitiosangium sp. (strain GDMCC 1.1324) TaxID=2138576 RepID=UPI000D3C330C|nr:thioredoxin domain-containing protein [Vitiosangium sp. GDMCC 1.1324]PTL83848.1 thioredoxin domain-containing protein [Vitiosangium sp. GDMCC 1.1324]
MAQTPQSGASNRLAREPSPYLRQHAANPVDWYPWGDEAFARARAENKPILLSVGYSACHWCHVMAHESFEDPTIAGLMNEWFINVKVDREERPDVDQIYQGVVQLMGQGGGWPLTVFLTPELLPFYGGTYFPPKDKYGRPGFPRVLEALHDAWTTKRDEVRRQSEEFREGLGELAGYGLDAVPAALKAEDIVTMGESLLRRVDEVNGGFGGAPKFPNPMNVAMLLRAWRRNGGHEALKKAALLTLEKMALGGIYDQLGGGFHRYSVDERWTVPHFEKMLYDNAQLLHLYTEAYQVEPRPLWRKVVEETAEYVRREMTDARGGFYATQDADSEGEEGKFFVWKPEQVREVLPPELAELAQRHFRITPGGNFEHGATVLEAVVPVETLARDFQLPVEEVVARLGEARRRLFEAREKRVKPGRDDKILAGWNGLMIRGLAFAGHIFEREDWVTLARRAADFLLSELWDGERLLRSYQEGQARIPGFLEDYGDLAAGLTALYQATFEVKYLEAAEALVKAAETRFWDAEKRAYLTAPRAQQDLVVATYATFDNAFPSGASTLTEAQVALAALTGNKKYLDLPEGYVSRMREQLRQNPMGYGHLGLAADALMEGAPSVTFAGSREAVKPLWTVTRATYAPTFAFAWKEPGVPVPESMRETFEGRDPVGGHGAAYLCRHFACEPPIKETGDLARKLALVPAST